VALRLTEPLAEFLESGASITMATADASGHPHAVRVTGAHVEQRSETVIVYLNRALASRTQANLELNPRLAVTFSRIIDHKSIQLKGNVRQVRETRPDERPAIENYIAAFSEQLYLTGLPRAITRRLKYWPSIAIEFGVSDVFVQTPGPRTGGRLEPEHIHDFLR